MSNKIIYLQNIHFNYATENWGKTVTYFSTSGKLSKNPAAKSGKVSFFGSAK